MAVNKVVINDEVVLDLTGDTVQAADLPKGVIAHSATGAKVTGTTNYAGSSNAGGSATSAEKLNNSLTMHWAIRHRLLIPSTHCQPQVLGLWVV